MRQALENLIIEWGAAIRDRQYRETIPPNDNMHAAWRGEAKAYEVASRDIQRLIGMPLGGWTSALQVILQEWEHNPEKYLGYQTENEEDFSDKLEYEVVEHERAIETLRACAEQLRGRIEQHGVVFLSE